MNEQKKSTTIKSYVSAVKAVLANEGIELNENRYLLNSLTRACKLKNDRIRTKLTLHKDMTHLIIGKVDTYFNDAGQPYLATLYKALFITAYYGLFRVSKITDGPHAIKAVDMHLGENKDKLFFILRTSKMHGRGSKPQQVKIAAHPHSRKNSSHCPFHLISEYIQLKGNCMSYLEPFFIFRGHILVTSTHMRTMLCKMLQLLGFDHKLYGTQAFQAGRASDLLQMGVSVETIKKLGRWKSNAVYNYLR